MSNRKKKIFSILGLISGLLVLLAGLISSLLAEEFKIWMKEKYGDYYLLIIIISALIILLISTWFYIIEKQSQEKFKDSDPDIRKKLLEGLRKRYENRLKQKMNNQLRFEIKLNLKYSIEGVSKETVENFIFKREQGTGDFNRLFNTYISKIKRLLILGEPGSGKTVLLLNFAIMLINLAEKNENFPIPVILNLASWHHKKMSFAKWLEQNLPYSGGELGISNEFSKELISNNFILPLLDGFDEIPEDYRVSCFEALNLFLEKIRTSKHTVQPEVIICSRINEYILTEVDAPVFAIVRIHPLTQNDVLNALQQLIKENDIPAKRLQEDLLTNIHLKKITSSAFFVHILLNLYSKSLIKNISKSDEILSQQEIVKLYINSEISNIDNNKNKSGIIRKRLVWLAYKLKNMKSGTTFELSDMQPTWLKSSSTFRLFGGPILGFIFGYIFGLITGFILGILFADYLIIEKELLNILIAGLACGLFFAWIFAFVIGVMSIPFFIFNINKIFTEDVKKINFNNIFRKKIRSLKSNVLRKSMIQGIVGTITFSLIFYLLLNLGFDPSSQLRSTLPIKTRFEETGSTGSNGSTGIASWYGPGFHGRKTASGEIYNMYALTAAHRTLPFGSFVKVTNLENDLFTVVRINDRGPYAHGRIIDLSLGAKNRLRINGFAQVKIEVVTEDEANNISEAFSPMQAKIYSYNIQFKNESVFPFLWVLIIAILGCIIYAFIDGLLTIERFPLINSPYRRLRAGFFRDMILLIIVLGCAGYFGSAMVNMENYGLILGILSGIIIKVLFSPISQHIVLRSLLYYEGFVPIRYVSFLNNLSIKTGLIEKEGGQWRITHEVLLENLSNQYKTVDTSLKLSHKYLIWILLILFLLLPPIFVFPRFIYLFI